MARTSGSAGQVLLLAPGVECGPAGDRHNLRLTRQRNIPAGRPHPPLAPDGRMVYPRREMSETPRNLTSDMAMTGCRGVLRSGRGALPGA